MGQGGGGWCNLPVLVERFVEQPTSTKVCGCCSLAAGAVVSSGVLLANPLPVLAALGCCGPRVALSSAKYGFYVHLTFVVILFPVCLITLSSLSVVAVMQRRWGYLLSFLVLPTFFVVEVRVLEVLRSLYRVLRAGGTGWEKMSAENLCRGAESPLLGPGFEAVGGESSLFKSAGFVNAYFSRDTSLAGDADGGSSWWSRAAPPPPTPGWRGDARHTVGIGNVVGGQSSTTGYSHQLSSERGSVW